MFLGIFFLILQKVYTEDQQKMDRWTSTMTKWK